MIVIVVCINCAIALMCLGVTWFLIKLKSRLASITRTLEMVERQTHAVLNPAPQAILPGKQAIERSRMGYQQIEPKLQIAFQILSLLHRLLPSQSKPTKIWGLVRRNRTRPN